MTTTNFLKIVSILSLSLLLSCTATNDQSTSSEASNLSSINRIHSTNFGIDQTEIDAIKMQMQAAIDGGFLPGALLLVGNSEGVGVLESVGYRAEGTQDPVNKDTIFRIYSMTKPVVRSALLP